MNHNHWVRGSSPCAAKPILPSSPPWKDALERLLLTALEALPETAGPGGLLVAVSGGSDSTALLRLAADTRGEHGRPVVLGHVHHGVRPDADAEERRLKEMGTRLAVPFLSERIRPERGDEATLRALRHVALRRLAREAECEWILLGHQRDDQIETLLMNLLRGTGIAGLRGMRWRRGRLVRPLLGVFRRVLREYLGELGEAWVDDPTNRDPTRLRNRIRDELIPLLRTIRPGAEGAIARAAEHLASVHEWLEARAEELLRACSLPAAPGEVRLDAARLRGYDEALIAEALRVAVHEVRGDTSDIPSSLWKGIVDLHARARAGRFLLARGVSLEITGRMVRIAKEGPSGEAGEERVVPWNVRIQLGRQGWLHARRIRLPDGGSLRVRGLSRGQVFDADAIRPPIRWRLVRSGDRLLRGGPVGSRSVMDLLAELGIPRSLRMLQPVLEDAEGILWVPGVRRADRALVGESTRRLWIVRWQGGLASDARLRGGGSR